MDHLALVPFESKFIIFQSVQPKGRSFTTNSGTKASVLPKADLPMQTQKQGCSFTRMNRCRNFPLHSAPHSLFSIRTDFKRSEKIPGAPTWKWGVWIWLTGPSGLHRNSPQGCKYQFHQGFCPDQRSGNSNYPSPRFNTNIIICNLARPIIGIWRTVRNHFNMQTGCRQNY